MLQKLACMLNICFKGDSHLHPTGMNITLFFATNYFLKNYIEYIFIFKKKVI